MPLDAVTASDEKEKGEPDLRHLQETAVAASFPT